jgi:hypothetical protein
LGRIDAPLFKSGHLEFYDDGPIRDTSQVAQFIRRAKVSKLLGEVEMQFEEMSFSVSFRSSIGPAEFSLMFLCSGLPAQVVIAERLCAQWPPLVSRVEMLKVGGGIFFVLYDKGWRGAFTPWLGLLRPFTAVLTLHLFGLATLLHVAPILREFEGERATEVLPALRTIRVSHWTGYYYYDDERLDASEVLPLLVGRFLSARKKWGHPVVISVDPKHLLPSVAAMLRWS